MSKSVEFLLCGKVNGVEITPQTIGLSQFNEFNQQVEAFIAGSQRSKLDQARAAVGTGSYVLTVALPPDLFSNLEPDLRLLQHQDALGELDPKRADVVQKWQTRTRNNPGFVYEVRSLDSSLPAVRISNETDFRTGAIVPWVAVEKYLYGQVVDMGGAQKPNVHLKLGRSGQTLLIGASQGYLRDLPENRLYDKALLHVRAEQHHRTGSVRNIQLIAFVDYRPGYDEEALERFAAKGAEAWADIPDAADWVRKLRGG